MSQPSDKRAHPRYDVNLDALITGEGFDARACKIRDFCAAGMFLGFDGGLPDVSAGTEFSIHFFLRRHSHDLRARVARVLPSGFGVALLDPESTVINALMEAVQASTSAEAAERSLAGAERSPAREPIIRRCRGLYERYLGQFQTVYFKAAEGALFLGARDAINNSEQQRFWDAQALLKKRRQEIEEAIATPLLSGFDHVGRPAAATGGRQKPAISGMALSLVNTQEFEVFLAITETADRAESHYRGQLRDLELRLSSLWAVKIDKVNNPLAPGGIARAFCDAVQQAGFDLVVQRVLYQACLDAVVPEFARLYGDLEGELKAAGVEPMEERPAIVKRQVPPPATKTVERVAGERIEENPAAPLPDMAPPAAAAPSGPVPAAVAAVPPAAGLTPSATPGPVTATSGLSGAYGSVDMPAGPAAAPVAGQPPMADGGATSAPVARSGGTVHAAHALLGLRRRLHQGVAPGGSAPPVTVTPAVAPAVGAAPGSSMMGAALPPDTAPGITGAAVAGRVPPVDARISSARPSAAAGLAPTGYRPEAPGTEPAAATLPFYSMQDLASAVGAMDWTGAEHTGGFVDGRDLRAQIEAAVRQQHTDKPPKVVNEQDWDVLELIIELFNAVLGDSRVIDDIKPLVRRLRKPVNQLALADPAFFDNADHPARQVLNRLAEVRSMTGADPEKPVGPQIEGIVNRITEQALARPEVFTEAAQEIQRITSEQREAYAGNIADIARAADEQQQFMKARRKAGGGEARPAPVLSGEWGEWLARVRRLKAGDELEIVKGDSRKKVNVAWVGEDHNALILADTLGHKVGSVGLQELAMQLRRGTTRALDHTRLAAVDRALYTSVQGLHGRLAQEAISDPLTTFLNEKAFAEAIDDAIREARQDGVSHALVMIEVDQAQSADEGTLQQTATVMRETAGADVQFGRFGDRILALLMRDVTQGRAFQRVDDIRAAIAGRPAPGADQPLTTSAGLTPFGSEAVPDRVISTARGALEVAKRAGGNTCRIHHVEEVQDAASKSRQLLGEQLVVALDGGSLQLGMQRIVPQRADVVLPVHVELMPSLALGSGLRAEPAALRDAAEIEGRSVDVDRWLIGAALRWVAEHADRLPPDACCLLRLSAATLGDAAMIGFITEQLLNSAVPPGRLCFELADTSGLGGRSDVDELVQSLREFGCRFAVGDFGSGKSSLARIKDLSIDLVRIARMGGRDVVNNAADETLVRSIVEMAHFLAIPVIADCVDSTPMLGKLHEIGVEYAQGVAVSALELLT
jgi:EAL domain-containing protein (putative c-di-GMP-specific phosphodiesterase class I)/GGDEF domain-containing protein